jgi:large subunit ribosomal protein L4
VKEFLGDVLLVEDFAVQEAKTKRFIGLVAETAGDARKVLVIGASFEPGTYLAARNVRKTLLVRAADVNTEQLLGFDKIVITKEALGTLSERLAR